MISDRYQIAKQIIEFAQMLHDRGMLAAADGNISYKISSREILITPSGVPKCELSPEQFSVISTEGDTLKGTPSSEKLMHLEVYRQCPKAQCVIHAHPPTAIAWSIAHPQLTELPSESLSEVILAVGKIPIVPYARPGSQEMGTHLVPFLKSSRVMILARHGALAWGESLREAYNGMERLEHSAKILKYAFELGAITPLPAEEVQALRKMREKIGDRTL